MISLWHTQPMEKQWNFHSKPCQQLKNWILGKTCRVGNQTRRNMLSEWLGISNYYFENRLECTSIKNLFTSFYGSAANDKTLPHNFSNHYIYNLIILSKFHSLIYSCPFTFPLPLQVSPWLTSYSHILAVVYIFYNKQIKSSQQTVLINYLCYLSV